MPPSIDVEHRIGRSIRLASSLRNQQLRSSSARTGLRIPRERSAPHHVAHADVALGTICTGALRRRALRAAGCGVTLPRTTAAFGTICNVPPQALRRSFRQHRLDRRYSASRGSPWSCGRHLPADSCFDRVLSFRCRDTSDHFAQVGPSKFSTMPPPFCWTGASTARLLRSAR